MICGMVTAPRWALWGCSGFTIAGSVWAGLVVVVADHSSAGGRLGTRLAFGIEPRWCGRRTAVSVPALARSSAAVPRAGGAAVGACCAEETLGESILSPNCGLTGSSHGGIERPLSP